LKRSLVCIAAIAVMAAPSSAAELPDPSEFEAYLDGLMAGHQDAYPYAGAVVSVVADGKVYFQKGYGFADMATREPVDPERTLFRIGSVSKLFTWTAIMQLLEEGKLDLDADVNTYLADLNVPETFDDPVTLRHLMNHSAGFEDRFIGLFAREGDQASIAEQLGEYLPARVRPPGLVTSYSNHGSALAALALSEAAGESWEDFVATHILSPMGMRNTATRQPPHPRDGIIMSKGYTNRNGVFREQPFEFVPLAPAGGISATADDMARFMIAHLQLGTLDGESLFAADTARRMQTGSFQNAPGVNGMAHGFMEMDRNGHRVIGHGGDTFWFHTLLALLPDHGVGIYASYNTDSGAEARNKLFDSFMDRYFAAEDPESMPRIDIDKATKLEPFEGIYRSNRMAYTTSEKLGAAMNFVSVRIDDDGALLMSGAKTIRTGEVEPLVFQEIGGHIRVHFLAADNGIITGFVRNDIPIFAFDRVPPSEDPRLHGVLLLVGIPVLLSGAIVWPLAAFRRRNDEPVFSQAHLPGAAKWTAWMASVSLLVFTIGFALAMSNPTDLVYGLPASIPALLCLPLIGAALTYVGVLFALLFCVRRIASLSARIHYIAVVTACAVLVWQLHTWNLLGFQY